MRQGVVLDIMKKGQILPKEIEKTPQYNKEMEFCIQWNGLT